jgi:hypothetical protein
MPGFSPDVTPLKTRGVEVSSREQSGEGEEAVAKAGRPCNTMAQPASSMPWPGSGSRKKKKL